MDMRARRNKWLFSGLFLLLLLLPTAAVAGGDAVGEQSPSSAEIGKGSASVPNRNAGFRFSTPQYVFIEVTGNASFGGFTQQDLSRWLRVAHTSCLASFGRASNIRVIDGKPLTGHYHLKVEMRVVTGREWSESREAERSSYSKSSESRDSSEETVYLTVQPVLYKVMRDVREVVVAPYERISAFESRTTGSGHERSFVIDHWYRRDSYWRRHEDSSSYRWSGSAEVARDMLLDGLSRELARQSVSLVLREWGEAVRLEKGEGLSQPKQEK